MRRIASLDIFRGLTVLVMVFVDNLDFVKGLPWWTYHMPRQANGMTYVDMVFPAFLFAMGMSIPISVDRRLADGESNGKVWLEVALRSLILVSLGLFIANGPQVNRQLTGIGATSWDILGFMGIAMLWGVFPWASKRERFRRLTKYAGLCLLVMLVIAFRRTSQDDRETWLDFSDWEILGLLGWAYLLVSSLYLILRKNVTALVASLVLLSALNVLSVAGCLAWLKGSPPYVQPFEAGLSSITMSGLIAYLIIHEGVLGNNFRAKIFFAVSYAVILALGAWLLSPFGISKLRDTPAWCLYCASANTLVVLFLYWIADLRRWTRWAVWIRPVGSNALLAYLLAYVAYFTPALFRLTADGTSGWQGVMRSLTFAALVLAVTSILTHFKFRLQV
jgi:heparan-alpha-glucosaminide N-acetyltransferase